MKQDTNRLNNYIADEGKTFASKTDNKHIGWIISLGEGDSIENYEEVDMNEDDLALKKQIEEEQERMFKHEQILNK